jgi:hypothetical protein
MSEEEATIHIEVEPEPESVEAVHDAVTAAIAEAEHREDVEETLDELREEQSEWQQTTSAILSAQSLMLDRLERMEAAISLLMTPPEATVIVSAPESSAMPSPESSSGEAETSPERIVEERVLAVEPEAQDESQDAPQSSRNSQERQSFYSPLRNLMRARRRHAG